MFLSTAFVSFDKLLETFNLVNSTASLIAAYFADLIKSISAIPILNIFLKISFFIDPFFINLSITKSI